MKVELNQRGDGRLSQRLTKKQIEGLKKKYQVDTIWSWSRYSCCKKDKYTYLLKYILHTPPDRFNTIYGASGGICHDIVESFYKGKIKYEDMIEEYEQKLLEMNLAELKYNRKDEEKNEKIADKYEANIRLFFKEHIPITTKMITEQFVLIKTKENLMQGYIDFVTKDSDGCYNIIDWKTSTIYTGKKIIAERGQLLLYAESIHQLGVPYEKIKIGWNFLKYCTVEYTTVTIDKETKKNKEKSKNCFRNEWVSEVSKDIAKWLKKMDYSEDEIEDMVYEACTENNLNNMPDQVKEKFRTKDCFVHIPYTEEDIEELINDIDDTINDITARTKEYQKTRNDELFWTEIDKTNEYYHHNLCDYGRVSHRPYREYLETLELFRDESLKDNDDNEDWINNI